MSELDKAQYRLSQIEQLVCALDVVSNDLAGTSIKDKELAKLRAAVVGITQAMAQHFEEWSEERLARLGKLSESEGVSA